VLAALYADLLDGIRMVGVVKETVDEEGLAEFGTRYFPHPLYCDKSRSLYRALGDRHVGLGNLLFNPLSLFGIVCDTWNRITAKQIQGNARGEGMVQGGVILFDPDGVPFAAIEEQTGVDLPVKDLVAAVQALRSRSSLPQQQQEA
jgi:hypothetical protein